MTRLAALDIGTNTALLLIADLDQRSNTLTTVFNAQEIIRLGKGVDAAGNINADAVWRLIACLKKYQSVIAQYGVTDIVAVGTSALRDAKIGMRSFRLWQKKQGFTLLRFRVQRKLSLRFSAQWQVGIACQSALW
jgi:Ppx/GppA phosphatase